MTQHRVTFLVWRDAKSDPPKPCDDAIYLTDEGEGFRERGVWYHNEVGPDGAIPKNPQPRWYAATIFPERGANLSLNDLQWLLDATEATLAGRKEGHYETAAAALTGCAHRLRVELDAAKEATA